jgi:heparinase II/III-like protein
MAGRRATARVSDRWRSALTLLLSDDELRVRSRVAAGPLAPLATSLAHELEPLLTRELFVPAEKALLSRSGGRCPRHGIYLEFDPFSPHTHGCPEGDGVFVGELNDRFWILWYQLWLVERALHGALLATIHGDARFADLAAQILDRYTSLYLTYPNRDNVLGPTRLFFSTYLESIWLLNLCIATDLLERDERFRALGQRVRDCIVEPSVALIASYDEGASNRQVWNDAAMLAAARLLDRREDAERAVFGRSGLTFHLQHGLLGDGTWYEGENYHLFAHRGLWYGVIMSERAGMTIPSDLATRFDAGFVAPFLTALPDLTLPSRRDSQYAISLRQPRFAELCELGIAHAADHVDPRLIDALARLYEDDVPRRDTGRPRSTADVERNLPATSLTRADLGWRSLLFALPELPRAERVAPTSVLLPEQGIAVLRRAEGRVYIALDYGNSGGGHGHPDRLNVLLSEGDLRWLDDMGTGSYVDPSLHWYRSTLAHNAPLFDGYQQLRVDGELHAYEEREHAGWVSARADGLLPGVAAMRTLVAMSDYFVDELVWYADSPVVMDLPIHVDPSEQPFTYQPRSGDTTALEDTLGALDDVWARLVDAHAPVHIAARERERALQGFLLTSHPGFLYRATAPGPPGTGRRPFLVLRVLTSTGAGWVRTIWSWNDAVRGVGVRRSNDATVVTMRDDTRDRHTRTLGGWRIVRTVGALRTAIELGGLVPRRSSAPVSEIRHPRETSSHVLERGRPLAIDLGEPDYRRSEETWEEAGRPTARVCILLTDEELVIDVNVKKPGALTFVASEAENPYDNEPADVNGDGIQLYLLDASGASAWMLVPELASAEEGTVRARVIDQWEYPRALRGGWQRRDDGYSVRVRIPAPDLSSHERTFDLGVVVNEMPPTRDRRRGQLVLGGGHGEFVYLRGDREERSRLVTIRLTSP